MRSILPRCIAGGLLVGLLGAAHPAWGLSAAQEAKDGGVEPSTSEQAFRRLAPLVQRLRGESGALSEIPADSLSEAEAKDVFLTICSEWHKLEGQVLFDRWGVEVLGLALDAYLEAGGNAKLALSKASTLAYWLMKRSRHRDCMEVLDEVLIPRLTAADPLLALCYRDQGEVQRLRKEYEASAKSLVQAGKAMDHVRALHRNPDPQLEKELLDYELQIEASWIGLGIAQARLDLASLHMQAYDALLLGPSSPGNVVDGYTLRLRILIANCEHAKAYEVYLEATRDPRLDSERSEGSGPRATEHLDQRGLEALASLVYLEGTPESQAKALQRLRAEREASEVGSAKRRSLVLHEGMVLNAMGAFEGSLALLDAEAPGPLEQVSIDNGRRAQLVRAEALTGLKVLGAERVKNLAGLRTAWEDTLDDWARRQVDREGAALFWYNEQRDLLSYIVQTEADLEPGGEGLRRGFLELLRAQSLGSLARALGQPRLETAEQADALLHELEARLAGTDSGYLIYLPAKRQLHIFGVEARGLWRHAVSLTDPRRKVIREGLVGGIRRVQRDPKSLDLEPLRSAASALYLPPEVLERIRDWGQVSIVGMESTGYLPFEYLHDEAGAALGLGRRVQYLPSLPVAHVLAERRSDLPAAAQLRSLLFACTDPGSANQARVPRRILGKADAAQLGRGLPPEGLQSVLGPGATRGAWLGADLNRTDLLHLFLHGQREPGLGRPRSLLSFGADPLLAEDLEAADLPPLVWLSACGAGAADFRPGDDGRHHLGGSCLLAGSSAVLLPMLPVESALAMALTSEVQVGMTVEGLSLGEALRRAREHSLREAKAAGIHEVEAFLQHLLGAGELRLEGPLLEGHTGESATSAAGRVWPILPVLLVLAAGGWALRRRS